MDTKEQPSLPPTPLNASRPRRRNIASILLLAAGLTVGSAALIVYSHSGADPVPPKVEPKGTLWDYEATFPNWPKGQKPDFVIVITGQTYGYLQKCGCSDPQKGGFERRFNLIEGFKNQGIEPIPIDLGDVAPEVSADHMILHEQALLKYETAMQCMKSMGYRVVGLGKEEFALGLLEAVNSFSLQPGNEQPKIVAANLIGMKVQNKVEPKTVSFPSGKPNGSLIQDWDVISTKSKITLGVVGIIGDPVIQQIKKIDPKLVFAEPPGPKADDILRNYFKAMKKEQNKPELNILLYTGPTELAEKAAKSFPEFNIVVCSSEEADPPNMPMLVNGQKSMIVHVGHKGQNIGVVGVFKNPAGGFDLKYQRVTLMPEFESPPGQDGKNLALKELDRYSKLVKDRQYLVKNRKVPHPLQVLNPNAKYAGALVCMTCHNAPPLNAADTSCAVWSASKHANAYNALAKIATRPTQRQFDGECIRCHTVGYDFNTGFVDAVNTPNLMNVGCESCHGPGSAHVGNPQNKALALELMPWKINGEGALPSVEKLKAYLEEQDASRQQKILTQQESVIMLRVDRVCQTCHNSENDPHFKFESFWQKVAHSNKPPAKPNAPKANAANGNPPQPAPSGPVLPLPK
jgi:2',3'-cyclic-nucleotide 2'-phosphodiesterase (5'-nucleotidase family)